MFSWHLKVSRRVFIHRAEAVLQFGAISAFGHQRETAHWPKPAKLTVCGLPLALSAMLIEATRDPVAEGVKVTLMVQLPPAGTEVPQVLLCAKSLAFAPVIEMLVMLKAMLPPLVRLTV